MAAKRKRKKRPSNQRARRRKKSVQRLRRPSGQRRRIARAQARPVSHYGEQLELSEHEKRTIPDSEHVAPPVRKTEADRQRQAIRALRTLKRRKEKFEKVRWAVKARKRDPVVVFVLANDQKRRGKVVIKAGTRVKADDRRAVFAFRKTRPTKAHPKGRLVPYRDYKEKERLHAIGLTVKRTPPKPVKIHSIDPTAFKTKKAKEFFYGGRRRAEAPVTVKRRQEKTLDFMDDVVPKVADRLQQAANAHLDRRDFELDCGALVKTPEGKTITVRFDVAFKQSDLQQFMELGFYEPFISRKLYAEMAQRLQGFGLVTTGSAQYIEALPINAGKDRRQWRDRKGLLWKRGKGWSLNEANLIRFEARPNLIMVGTRRPGR